MRAPRRHDHAVRPRPPAGGAEPLESRRLLSVGIVEPYEHAAEANRVGFFADFTSDARPTEVYASWGDGTIENLIHSRMIDYDPATNRGTVYGIYDYDWGGRYAITFTVKGNGATFDSSTFLADVSAPELTTGDGLGAGDGLNGDGLPPAPATPSPTRARPALRRLPRWKPSLSPARTGQPRLRTTSPRRAWVRQRLATPSPPPS